MISLHPVSLRGFGVTLEPTEAAHAPGLAEAASDGELWNLSFTSIPRPEDVDAYVASALERQKSGDMLVWTVRDNSGRIVGSTRYHDIVASIDRVEIGFTWYAKSAWGTHVNPACKFLLLQHAFDDIGCAVVGLRTDGENLRSQKAIESLGARRDGMLRHFGIRRDGAARDSVMFSILSAEWSAVRSGLRTRLAVTAS